MQRHGELTDICIDAVSQLMTHWIKRLSSGSIRFQSHLAEVFVEP